MSHFHYINGKITTESEALISVFDLGVLRSYGVFDYVQLYEGVPLHMDMHLRRLEKSVRDIGLELPMPLEQIQEAAWKVIEKNDPIDAGIRFMVTGGLSNQDYLIPIDSTSLIILFHPTKPYPDEIYKSGMRAVTTRTMRLYPHIKSTGYLPAIFAMKDAKARGFHDALYLNERDEILEGTTCNAFFVKDGTLITDNSNQIVHGVTRDLVIGLAKDRMPIEFRAMPLSEVSSCQEAFLTSSVKDCVPLVQVDDHIIGSGAPGVITQELRARFRSYVQEHLANQKQLIGR